MRICRIRRTAVRCATLITAAVCGLTLGVVIRSTRPSNKPPSETETIQIGENVPESFESTAQSTGATDAYAKTLFQLTNSVGVTHWLHWFAALEKATTRDFPRLAQLAKGNVTAQRFLAARWVEMAPAEMFDEFVASVRGGKEWMDNELVTTLFREWPKRDPDAAIAALTAGLDFGMRDRFQFDVAYALLDTDVERAFRLMADWNVETTGLGPRGVAAVAKWTAANPRHAAEFVLQQPAGYAAVTAIEAVGEQWAKIDPASATSFAVDRRGDLAGTLARAALKQWSETDVTSASMWLASIDDRTRNRLSLPFVQAWAKQDAAAAVDWCQKNLAGSALSQAVGSALSGAAEKDVRAAANMVTAMESSSARAVAAAAVAKKWFPQMASGKPAPQEAISWLGSLDDASMRRVIEHVTWDWATSDPVTMAAFIAGTRGDHVPDSAYKVVGREMARNNPLAALEWASQLTEGHGFAAGAEIIAEWRLSQPAAAQTWLEGIPAGDAPHRWGNNVASR